MQTLRLWCRLFLCGESLLCSCAVSQSVSRVVERISQESCLDESNIVRLESSAQYPNTLSLWGSRPEDLEKNTNTCFNCSQYESWVYWMFIDKVCISCLPFGTMNVLLLIVVLIELLSKETWRRHVNMSVQWYFVCKWLLMLWIVLIIVIVASMCTNHLFVSQLLLKSSHIHSPF